MEHGIFQKIIDTEDSQKIIEAYLNQDSNDNKIDIVHSDYQLEASDIDSMKKHNQYFNELLSAYVKNADKNLRTKLGFKKNFFNVCIGILIAVTTVMLLTIIIALFKDFETSELISIALTNVVSFMTSFIILPKTIADYLFNTDEEKNMSDIIKSIQDYDKDIRNGLK